MRHCIGIGHTDDLFLEDVPLDRAEIVSQIIYVYTDYPYKDALMLSERALEYSRKKLGDECCSTWLLSNRLARILNSLREHQKASDLLQGMVDVSIQKLGPANETTLLIMDELICAYRCLGWRQEALELAEKRLAICAKSFEERDYRYSKALQDAAIVHHDLDRNEEAVDLLEKVLVMNKEMFHEEDAESLGTEHHLARAYSGSGHIRPLWRCFRIFPGSA